MILADWQIIEGVEQDGMIENFVDHQVRDGVISYGLSSFGYDMRLSEKYKVFRPTEDCTIVDPKAIDERIFAECISPSYVIIPPNSYVLGYSIEKFNMPMDTLAVVLGKSTYARAGVIVNVTPLEPGWRGHVTIEISNATPLPVKVYSNEGIAQVIFLSGENPDTSYDDRKGKYQDQIADIVLSKV